MAIVLAEQFYGSVAKLANQHIMMKHGKFIRGRTGDDKESDGLRVSMSMSMSMSMSTSRFRQNATT